MRLGYTVCRIGYAVCTANSKPGGSTVYYFIEPMVENDIERVQEIERRSFSTPWSANTYRHELRHPSTSRYIVARASPTPPPPRHEGQPQRRGLLASLLPSLF